MIKSGEVRQLYKCKKCDASFSETKNTVIERLRTPLSVIIMVLNAISEGLGTNAAAYVFKVGKNSIIRWTERLSDLKETLFIYSLCNEFIKMVIEGDELYTKIGKNVPPSESEGWTIVLMDRASRFIWALECGKKDERLFKRAMRTLLKVIRKTEDLTLLTDGERRYGNILFEICYELLKTGKRGRPRKVLKKGVKTRIKNKGAQRRPGRKRKKYEAPHPEHPETEQDIELPDIHADHVVAFNASPRRKCSGFRRKANTYAENVRRLQERDWFRIILLRIFLFYCKKHVTFQRCPKRFSRPERIVLFKAHAVCIHII